MKKQFDPWEQNLGKRLKELKPEPAFDAWDRIDAELHKKPHRPWFWIAASLAFFVASAGLIVWQTGLWPDFYTYTDQQVTEQTGFLESSETRPSGMKNKDAATILEKADTPELAQQPEAKQQKQQNSLAENTQPGPKSSAKISADNIASLGGNESSASAVATNTNSEPKHTTVTTTSATTSGAAATNSSTVTASGFSATASSNSATAIADKTSSSLENADELDHQQSIYLAQPVGLKSIASIAPAAFPLDFKIEMPSFSVMAEYSKGVVPDKAKKVAGISVVTVWVEAMPTWSYRRVVPNQTDAVVITSIEQQAAFAGSRMGGQLAAGISYPLSKKLKWKSGAYYWYQQQRWSYTYHTGRPVNYVTRTFANTNSLAVTPMYSEQNETVDLTLHNLGISTGISYQLPTTFAPSTLETKIMAHYNTQLKFSSTVSVGYLLQAMLDKKRKLSIGPSMQIQLNNNQNLSPHFQERPVSAGMQMGVTF